MGVVFISSFQALLSCLFTVTYCLLRSYEASQVALVVKNLPASAGDMIDKVSISGWEDLLEEAMATNYSIHAWTIPWSEEPGRLWFTESQSVRHD